MVRLITITPTDFPLSWQAGHGDTLSGARGRSHDSRSYGKRFMLRLDEQTWQTLESLAHHFKQSHAEIIRQLIVQARLENFPQSWQVGAEDDR